MARMRKAAALAAVAVLGLGAAACGGDDDSAGEDTEVDETTTTEATDDGGSDDGDTGGSSGSGGLGAFAGEECLAFTNAILEASSSVGNVFTGQTDDLESVAAYFSEVADNLPAEIRDDFRTFAGAYETFAAAVADADIDFEDPSTFSDPAVMQRLTPAMEAFDSAEVQQASENIERWLDETCSEGQ